MDGVVAGAGHLTGRYRDTLTDPAGQVRLRRTGHNVVCVRIWPLLAALLKGDPAIQAPLYLAVGAGQPEWDLCLPRPDPLATRLTAEVAREPIDPERISYLDATGQPVGAPTGALRMTASFRWTQRHTLREFGVFGADDSGRADTGYQLDHVIHPALEVTPGYTLTRTVDLTFGAGAAAPRPPAEHWLAGQPVTRIDGVGRALAARLDGAGVRTILDLTAAPAGALGNVPPGLAAALRGKGRIALQAAAQLPPDALADQRPDTVLAAAAAALATRTGTPLDLVERVQDQLTRLEICLDHNFLNQFTVGQLAAPAPP